MINIQAGLLSTCSVAQNKWSDRSRPLIVHACSSTTYPYSHYKIYRENVYPFYQQNPCKLRFTLGTYVRCLLPASSTQHFQCKQLLCYLDVHICWRHHIRKAMLSALGFDVTWSTRMRLPSFAFLNT